MAASSAAHQGPAPPRSPGATAGVGPGAATSGPQPVHPSARSPPEPAAAPAAVRCSASPSPCGAARLGPAPTPRSPRRPPGPPSSAHVTAAGSPQTTLSATAGTQGHAASGAGPTGAPPQTPPLAPWSRPWLCLCVEQAGALVPMESPKGLFGVGGAHCCQGRFLFIPRPWSQDPSRSGDCLQESHVACGQPRVLQPPVCHRVLDIPTP